MKSPPSDPLEPSRPDHQPSAETVRGLDSAWAGFMRFCADTGRTALPANPEAVVDFLLFERDRVSLSSLYRTIRAVKRAHARAGISSPTDDPKVRAAVAETREAMNHILAMNEGPAVLTVSPDFPPDLIRMVEAAPDDLAGLRDKAVLLLGRAARLNRTQLVQLQVDDVEVKGATSLRVRTRERGTPLVYGVVQEDAPAHLSVGRAVLGWLAASEITSGLLFRGVDRWGNVRDRPVTPQAVTVLLQKAAERAGVPPDQANTTLFTRP